jgi:tRNA pseudouridine55 synthase
VSAIKVGGERAHRLTRRGEPPALEPRAIRVERLTLVAANHDRITVEVTATKGYYVRSLARDLGEALGVPAHLSSLRRTRSGDFRLDNAVAWPPGEPPPLVPVVDVARRTLPCSELTEPGAAKARLGQRLRPEHFVLPPVDERPHAWLHSGAGVVAIGIRDGEEFRVARGFRA